MHLTRRLFVLALLSGCANSGPGIHFDMGPGADLTGVVEDLAGVDLAITNSTDLAGPTVGCIENTAYCSAWNTRSYCDATGGTVTWKTESCAAGCFQGACSATACADECSIGATSTSGTCKLWDLASQSYVTTDQSMLVDRAREHDAQTMRITKTALGAMVNPEYTDATHTTLSYYWGTRDAAIWSGSWLAGESWRLLATGSKDASDEVTDKVKMLHDYFKVTGDVGYLARLALPRTAAVPTEYNYQGQSYCATEYHCNVDYKSAAWDWVGGTSRDAYTGTMLGLGMAYLASPDEATRALIREDVTNVALELSKMHTIPVALIVDGIPTSTTVTLENVIVAPSEFTNGKAKIVLSTSTASTDDDEMQGIRDFLPDYDVFVKQVIPFLKIPIPRPSTAMMLGAFFNIALRASKGVPGYEATHDALQAYYDAHADAWLQTAITWSYGGGCDAKYYPNHIAYISAYMWALLEENTLRKGSIADGVLQNRMWSAMSDHKNAYFAYLWGGTRSAMTPPDPTAIASANTQLAGFMNAPKAHPGFDHLASYPNDGACNVGGYPASTTAVDVKDRRMDDFIWQRGAWQLKDGGDANTFFPATDYIAAYWAARYHKLLTDDRVGTCTRWSP